MGIIETKTKEKVDVKGKTILEVVRGMNDNDIAAVIQSLLEIVEDHELRISKLEKP